MNIRKAILIALAGTLPLHASNLVFAATSANVTLQNADRNTATPGVSPIRRIERDPAPERRQPVLKPQIRSIDGSGNNLDNPDMNATHTHLRRYLPADYSDEVSTLAGASHPGAREVSNAVAAQDASKPNGLQDQLYRIE